MINHTKFVSGSYDAHLNPETSRSRRTTERNGHYDLQRRQSFCLSEQFQLATPDCQLDPLLLYRRIYTGFRTKNIMYSHIRENVAEARFPDFQRTFLSNPGSAISGEVYQAILQHMRHQVDERRTAGPHAARQIPRRSLNAPLFGVSQKKLQQMRPTPEAAIIMFRDMDP